MIELSRAAEKDLREHLDFLTERSPLAAHKLAADLDALLQDLDSRAFEEPEVQLRSGCIART